MIIRAIPHDSKQGPVICDGSEPLKEFDGIAFYRNGYTYTCMYDSETETHVKFNVARRYHNGPPVIYYVNLTIESALKFTVDDMYYQILESEV